MVTKLEITRFYGEVLCSVAVYCQRTGIFDSNLLIVRPTIDEDASTGGSGSQGVNSFLNSTGETKLAMYTLELSGSLLVFPCLSSGHPHNFAPDGGKVLAVALSKRAALCTEIAKYANARKDLRIMFEVLLETKRVAVI